MRGASLPWIALLTLGAIHGINPAMGWLFAVGRGLQERDRRAVWRALGPLAAGHALAIAVAVLAAVSLGRIVPLDWLRWIVAAALVLMGLDGLVRHRHVARGGMRLSARELATWSFLMASAHGAGLMVLPFVLGSLPSAGPSGHHVHTAALLDAAPAADAIGVVAPLLHTAGYLAVTAAVAVVVYERVGLRILRRAWINLNVVWSASLIVAAVAALLT